MNATEALERIIALEELSHNTGVKTYKTVNTILASLSADALTEVALELKRRNTIMRALSTPNGTEQHVNSQR